MGGVLVPKRQQMWQDSQVGVRQSASFAGQEMVAAETGAGAYELAYLGFKEGGFRSIAAAKSAAPGFAKRVLARMSAMIVD